MKHDHGFQFTVAALALLGLTSGCHELAGPPGETTPPVTTTSRVERVVAAPPVRKTLVVTTSQPARIEAFEETPLHAKLAGYVDQVHVDIGDPVKAGQPLVTLRIPELANDVQQKQAKLAQGEAEVAQAAANIDAMKAAAETAAAGVAEATAGIGRAKADVQRWSAEHERTKQLATGGSVTQKLVEETQNQLSAAQAAEEQAAAAVQSAEASAREAQAMIAKAEADHAAARARLGVAKAELDHAEIMLGYSTIAAPFDGVVTHRSIDTGHFVQPASGTGKPLLVVARIDKVRVFLDVPEMESGLVDVGDEAVLRVQALQGKELKAPVTRTSWSLDSSNRSLRVEVDFPNEGSVLRPGMYATGTIELGRRENVLTLPLTAIVRAQQETYCYVVDSGKVRRQPISLGLRSGREVEVLDGLNEKSMVVSTRADGLTDGQMVEVIVPES